MLGSAPLLPVSIITAPVPSGLGPAQLVQIDPSWTRDASWASSAALVDGRICLSGTPRPYVAGDCGGSPICNWEFINVAGRTCDASAYAEVLFQVDRWLYAQQELTRLLTSRPAGRSSSYARAWADWCADVMQCVTLARWASNIRERYQPRLEDGPATAAAIASIWTSVNINPPTKIRPTDSTPMQDRRTLALFAPRIFGPSDRLPTERADFEPYCTSWGPRGGTTRSVEFRRSVGPTAGMLDPAAPAIRAFDQPWTYDAVTSRSMSLDSSDVRALMTSWFAATLSQGYWHRDDIAARISYPCQQGLAVGACTYLSTVRHWWGGADAQIAICEAMAQDIIATPFSTFVADAMQEFLDQYALVPENLRIFKDTDLNAVKAALQAGAFDTANAAAMTAIGIAAAAVNVVPGAGQIASAVIAVIGALVQGLFELLKGLGVAAIGGAELSAACLPPPTVRAIITESGTQACNFDPTRSLQGQAAARVQAVITAARAGAAVETWIDSVQYATGETSTPPSYPSADAPPPPPPEETKTSWMPWIVTGAAAVAVGAILAKRRK